MKLSVRKKMWGAVHARGGRVLRVTREHPVTTDTFDPRDDDRVDARVPGTTPLAPRAFDNGEAWKIATVGAVAIEIVARKTSKIVGYAYLSGPTIALHRYVDDQTRAFYAGCFEPAVGWKIDFEAVKSGRGLGGGNGKTLKDALPAMMRVKYGEAAVAQLTCICDSIDTAKDLGEVITKLWKYEPSETNPSFATRDWKQVTHLLALIEIKRDKQVVALNCQPPAEASPYAVQLFHHHLVESSPDLVRYDIWRQS